MSRYFKLPSVGMRVAIRKDWQDWRGIDPPDSPIGLPFDGLCSCPFKDQIDVVYLQRDYSKLPPCLENLQNLKEIEVEIGLATAVFRHEIGRRLKRISILGEGRLNPRVPLPKLTHLFCQDEVEFNIGSFPGLEHIEISCGGRKVIFNEVCKFTKLLTLALSGVPKAFDLGHLPNSIEHLQLQRGSFAELTEICHLNRLQEIRLRGLRHLKSIQPLTAHECLRSVEILNCPNVDLSPLLDLPNLKDAWLFGQSRSSVAANLRAKGVLVH